jgi:hypothetical protein
MTLQTALFCISLYLRKILYFLSVYTVSSELRYLLNFLKFCYFKKKKRLAIFEKFRLVLPTATKRNKIAPPKENLKITRGKTSKYDWL